MVTSPTEDSVVGISICVVAPTGGGLESTPVEDRDIAARVMDQAALLESARGLGDADPADAKHQG
jgi:hypothetical protein